MLTFGDWLNLISLILSAATVSFALYLYFKDPIKRWRFIGYRPTIILSIFDPDKSTLLVIRHEIGDWQLVQTGIYEDSIVSQISHCVNRELDVKGNLFDLRYIKELGVIKDRREPSIKRSTLGYMSLFNEFRGRGYISAYIVCDQTKLKKLIRPGFGIIASNFVHLDEAGNFLRENSRLDKNNIKLAYYLEIISDIQGYIRRRAETIERVNTSRRSERS